MAQPQHLHPLRDLVIFILILAIVATIAGTGWYAAEFSVSPHKDPLPPENLGLPCREVCHTAPYGGQICRLVCT